MKNCRQCNQARIFARLIPAVLALLLVGCSSTEPAVPTDMPGEMSETIQRLQQVAPQLQQQLDQIEKIHPNLDRSCSSSYPWSCIPPAPPDLDCDDVAQKNFLVLPPDPHQFDPDGNGIGCEE